jgi:hypothetical protein
MALIVGTFGPELWKTFSRSPCSCTGGSSGRDQFSQREALMPPPFGRIPGVFLMFLSVTTQYVKTCFHVLEGNHQKQQKADQVFL